MNLKYYMKFLSVTADDMNEINISFVCYSTKAQIKYLFVPKSSNIKQKHKYIFIYSIKLLYLYVELKKCTIEKIGSTRRRIEIAFIFPQLQAKC